MAWGAGWQYVLRRGCTTTSLSVRGQESTSRTLRCAMKVLNSQGLDLYDLGTAFPRLEQISVGRSRRCHDDDYDPMYCNSSPFDTHTYFAALLSNVKVCSSLSSAQTARSVKDVHAQVAAIFQGSAKRWHTAGGGHDCSNAAKALLGVQTIQGGPRKLLKAASPHADDRSNGVLP